VALDPKQLLVLEVSDFRDVLGGCLRRAGELEQLSDLRLRSDTRLDEIV
jgi:hypothetical protein